MSIGRPAAPSGPKGDPGIPVVVDGLQDGAMLLDRPNIPPALAVPTPPETGTYQLQAIDGALSWVAVQ